MKTLYRLLLLVCLPIAFQGCSSDKKAIFEKRAKSYFESGDYDKAKIEYQNVLRVEAKNLNALKQLGTIWMEQGAPLRAIEFLSDARQLDPQDYSLRLKFAEALLAISEPAAARKELLDILKTSSGNGEALLLLTAATSPKEAPETRKIVEQFPDHQSAPYHLALATLQATGGDIPGAEKSVQAALTADPKFAPAHRAMAGLCLLRKDPEGAETASRTAAELAPVRGIERVQYAEFKADSGKKEEALSILKEITSKAPDTLPAWILTAKLANSEKKYDEALSALSNVTSRDPYNLMGVLLQADLLLSKNDPKQAITVLEKLAATYPGQPMVQYQLGRAFAQNNEINKAREILSKVISGAAQGQFVDAELLLADLRLRNGEAAQVIVSTREILKKSPENVKAMSLLAYAIELQHRNFPEGISLMEKLVAAEPANISYRIRLGRFHAMSGDFEKARKAFLEGRKLAPDDMAAAADLIDLELADKHPEVAMSLAKEMTAKLPKSAPAHFFLGKVLAVGNSWEAAEASLQLSLDLDSTFIPAYEFLIQSYISQEKLPRAMERLDQVLAKNPKDLQALMLSALISEKQKSFSKARECYERMLEVNPNIPAVLNNLATLYSTRFGEIDKALELSARARSMKSVSEAADSAYLKMESASIADTLGWIQYQKGNFAEALALIQEAVQQFPEVPELLYHYGMAACMMGRLPDAAAALEKAQAAAADFFGKAEIPARLALLKPADGKAPAAGTLTPLIQAKPGDVLLHILLAQVQETAGDYKSAATTWQQAFKLNPRLAMAPLRQARLYSGPLKEPEKALEFARQAWGLAPGDPETAGVLGVLLHDAGAHSEAYPLLKACANVFTHDASVLYSLAWTSYIQNMVKPARTVMEQFLKEEKDTPRAVTAAQFLTLTDPEGNSTGKEALARQILPKIPDSVDVYSVPSILVLTASQAKAGQGAEAAATVQKLLKRFPDFAPAQAELAALSIDISALRDTGYDLALKARESFKKADENPADLARTLAILNYYRKDYSFTVELYKEAPPVEPRMAEHLYFRGMARWHLNEKKEGLEDVRAALATGQLPQPIAAEAQKILTETKGK